MARVLLRAVFASWLVACTADMGTGSSNLPPLGRTGGAVEDAGVLDDGGAPGTDATVSPSTAASACADLAQARCAREDACTGGVHAIATYGSQGACVVRRTALCVATLAAPATGDTPATVEACAQSIPAQSCADVFDGFPTVACATPAGSLTTGAACIASAQCASSYCAIAPDAVCGSCASAPRAGDKCASNAECGGRGGLTCASGVCLPVGRVGAGCGPGIPCGFGLSCVGATASAPGTCQVAASDAGAACDPSGVTAPACDALLGLACDSAAKRCVSITFVAAGQPCGDLASGVAACAAGTCALSAADAGTAIDAGARPDAGDAGLDASTDAATAEAGADASAIDASPPPAPASHGACVGSASEGAPCDPSLASSCLPPAKCVPSADGGAAATCTLPSPTICH